MTQHTLFDIIYDTRLYHPEHCVHEDYDDFRGLTCCQAGRWLQATIRDLVPDLVAVVEHLNDRELRSYREAAPADRGRHVYRTISRLKRLLTIENLHRFEWVPEDRDEEREEPPDPYADAQF
ncbi:MAG: hypothetical protein K2X87_19295 [Gemmataceae bacterium]|nr:hypothetical protein [Gemmataceae bacterium]